MHKTMALGIAAGVALIGVAKADPVDLSAYADANGFIDVQTLTCAQLANTYQEDANALTSWYSVGGRLIPLSQVALDVVCGRS
jgi:hypothetical protein